MKVQLCLEQYNNWPYTTYLFFEWCYCSGHSSTDYYTKCRIRVMLSVHQMSWSQILGTLLL